MLVPPRSHRDAALDGYPQLRQPRLPRREIDDVDRKRQMDRSAAVVARDEAARRFQRAGIAALKQQQHRLLAGVERDESRSPDSIGVASKSD